MADPKDAAEAKRVTKMFKRIAAEMAKRPELVRAGKAGIAVGDLFAPVPGGKLRSAARAENLLRKKLYPLTKNAWKKIAAKRAAKNEAEKAALAAGGLGYAAAKNKKK